MIINLCKKATQPDMTVTKDKDVETVDIFKYFGVTLDNKLTWIQNTEAVVKTKPRICCLRNLRSFNVHRNLFQLFYSSIVGSTMIVGLGCWRSNLWRQDRERVDKLIKTPGGVVGKIQENIMAHCERRILNKMKLIFKDKTHTHTFNVYMENNCINVVIGTESQRQGQIDT